MWLQRSEIKECCKEGSLQVEFVQSSKEMQNVTKHNASRSVAQTGPTAQGYAPQLGNPCTLSKLVENWVERPGLGT
jgi:hypothetical protein